MLAAGHTTFYKAEDGAKKYHDIPLKVIKHCRVLIHSSSLIISEQLKKQSGRTLCISIIPRSEDGILNVEFHLKMNTIGDTLQAINKATDLAG